MNTLSLIATRRAEAERQALECEQLADEYEAEGDDLAARYLRERSAALSRRAWVWAQALNDHSPPPRPPGERGPVL